MPKTVEHEAAVVAWLKARALLAVPQGDNQVQKEIRHYLFHGLYLIDDTVPVIRGAYTAFHVLLETPMADMYVGLPFLVLALIVWILFGPARGSVVGRPLQIPAS